MSLFSNIYDGAKGIQWPGLIGGLVGGLFIFNKLGGMEGGMLGMLGTAIAVLTGAWIANKGVELIGGFIKNHFGKGGPTLEAAVPGQVIQKPIKAPNTEHYKPRDIGDIAPVNVDGRLIGPATQSMNDGTNPNAKLPVQPVGKQPPQLNK